MSCPVCAGSYLSDDVSVVEEQGKRVIIQGRVNAIYSPYLTPFSDWFTVSLYPSKGRVKYLKFRTQNELDKWKFIRDTRIKCHGCLHEADGKAVVFDITKVEFL